MNSPLAYVSEPTLELDHSLSWWDAVAECTMVMARPSDEPGLWREYLDGAVLSYRKHGVEAAVDYDAIKGGADTAVFYAAVDGSGAVIGGVRGRGLYTSADDSHAVVEWAGQPGLAAVRKMITDRLPYGVVEIKTAWTTDDRSRRGVLTQSLARTPFHTMELLSAQFAMATSAAHTLEKWKSSGGVVATRIPGTPYPDERYQTKIMWWDTQTFTKHAEPSQVSRILTERRALSQRLYDYTVAEAATGA